MVIKAIPKPANRPDKGLYGGSCNITSCQQPGAYWFHHSNRVYYCQSCARMLNRDPFNKADAMRLYGHDLCTLVMPKDED